MVTPPLLRSQACQPTSDHQDQPLLPLQLVQEDAVRTLQKTREVHLLPQLTHQPQGQGLHRHQGKNRRIHREEARQQALCQKTSQNCRKTAQQGSILECLWVCQPLHRQAQQAHRSFQGLRHLLRLRLCGDPGHREGRRAGLRVLPRNADEPLAVKDAREVVGAQPDQQQAALLSYQVGGAAAQQKIAAGNAGTKPIFAQLPQEEDHRGGGQGGGGG